MKSKKNRRRRYDPLLAEVRELMAQVAALPPPDLTWTSRAPAARGGAREAGAEWVVDVEPWLAAEGAYGVLQAGRTIDFALEFEALALEAADVVRPRALALGEGVYEVEAKVVRVAEECCVIDFGLLAFTHHAPEWLREGAGVRGDLALTIDPDWYRFGGYDHPDLPALIYPWHIDRIVLENAARVPAPDEVRARWGNPEMMTNDPEARTLRDIGVVNCEKDWPPGQFARYHLHCTLQSRIPRRPDATDRRPAVVPRTDA
jgi:hypothetical protein